MNLMSPCTAQIAQECLELLFNQQVLVGHDVVSPSTHITRTAEVYKGKNRLVHRVSVTPQVVSMDRGLLGASKRSERSIQSGEGP